MKLYSPVLGTTDNTTDTTAHSVITKNERNMIAAGEDGDNICTDEMRPKNRDTNCPANIFPFRMSPKLKRISTERN